MQTAYDMPRKRAARALRLADYGIEVGRPANFVFLAADDAQQALRLQPARRILMRNGRLVPQGWEQDRLNPN
jgi:cytosine deaminase